MAADKRLFDRIHLEEPEWIPCEGIGYAFSGRIAVLSLGGVLVNTPKRYAIGTLLSLRLKHGLEIVEADCIVRDFDGDRIGLEFVKFRGSGEDRLKEILERLRA